MTTLCFNLSVLIIQPVVPAKKAAKVAKADATDAPLPPLPPPRVPFTNAPGDLKIITYNVNGLRACDKNIGFVKFMTTHQPDILALQEIKCEESEIPFTRPPGYFQKVFSATQKARLSQSSPSVYNHVIGTSQSWLNSVSLFVDTIPLPFTCRRHYFFVQFRRDTAVP
jgi:hypothetical protein